MEETETRPIPPLYNDHQNINIHIDVSTSGHKYGMLLRAIGGQHLSKIDLLPKDLYQLNSQLRDAFTDLAEEPTNKLYIKKLATEGYNAFLQIFDKDARIRFREFLSYFRDAVIEVRTDDFFIPWELLYVANPEESLSTENFLGSRHIIARMLDRESPFIMPYIYQSIPRIGLLMNNKLEYVKAKEMPFFDMLRRANKITLLKLGILNPSRKREGLRDFEVFLADHLDIAHFACHAYGDQERHMRSSMELSNEFEITLDDLRMLEELRMPDNPIVILNACGTGNINSEHASFFAKDFLQFGARGVIATECEIPDDFAAEFTKQFYPEFLNGTPIGEALLKTRKYFIEEHKNLTALIYSMYASPLIRIVNNQIVFSKGARYEQTIEHNNSEY